MGRQNRSCRWVIATVCLVTVAALGSYAVDVIGHRLKSIDEPSAPASDARRALPTASVPPSPQSVVQTSGPQRKEMIVSADHFGRYALKLASAQGAELQLVDRMAGPGPSAGVTGLRDGRLDVFLGPGEHKVVESFAPGAQPPELTVHPFEELNGDKPPQLVEQTLVNAELGDAQQRSYWMVIPNRQTVFIEAAGRYLADLRLWKDGSWLIPTEPSSDQSEPHPGQPLAIKRLVADLEPGLYRLMAYGGPGITWSQAGTDKPFALRWGIPSLPETSRRQLVTGPFGYDRWLVGGGDATYFRLELPRGEQGSLEIGSYDNGQIYGASSAKIDKTSRDPIAELSRQQKSGSDKHLVTVRAQAGQAYVLQSYPARREYLVDLPRDTPYLLAAVKPGLGEDDPDLTVLLSEIPEDRKSPFKEKAIADQTIRLGPTTPWRRRFNLMSETVLFVNITQAGRYRVDATGVQADVQVQPFLVSYAPAYKLPPAQLNGGSWNLDAGFYRLILTPRIDGRGIVSLSLHSEGAPEAVEAAQPLPTGAVFAPVTLKPKTRYVLGSSQAAGFIVRKLPADLTEDLPVLLPPNGAQTLTLPVTFPQTGSLQALAEDGQAVPLSLDSAPASEKAASAAGPHSVQIGNPGAAPLMLSLHFTPEAKPGPVTLLPVLTEADAKKIPNLPVLSVGQPRFLDLDLRQSATFLVKVDTPALYRVETTGLLETTGTMRTHVQPNLASAAANGVGRNMLLQNYLREGIYLLTVAPQGRTRGHLGLTLTAAPVRQGGALSPDIAVHASLGSGEGIAYDFDVSQTGSYHLRVLTPDTSAPAASPVRPSGSEEEDQDDSQQTQTPSGAGSAQTPLIRLEDATGWPLTTPDQIGDLTRELTPGHYHLIIQPPLMPSRVLTLVEQLRKPEETSGHGPHPLPLGTTVANRWDEPAEGQPRTPDSWDVTLPADADLTITVSDGMQAVIMPDTLVETAPTLSFLQPWHGHLSAGHYTLQLTSVRPNNRLDYTLTTAVDQLVAGQSRSVTAPIRLPVALGGDRRIELTSFGSGQVKASLLDAQDRVVAQGEDRADDWNINLAARLPGGQYMLKLDPIGQAQATTEVSLRELVELQDPPMAAGQDRQWTDGALHSQSLTFAAADSPLIVASAKSHDAVGLALERHAADGTWISVASASGANAALAFPRDPATADDYRLQIWPLAGSRAPIALSLRSPALLPESEGTLASGLSLQPLPGIEPPLGVAAVKLPSPGLIRLASPPPGLIWGDGGERRALIHGAGVVAVGSGPLWFVGPVGGATIRGQRVIPSADAPLNLALAAGQTVVLPLTDDGRGPRLWLADSRIGQPALSIAPAKEQADLRSTGLDAGSAAALLPDSNDSADKTIRLWRSDDSDEMPVSLRRINFPRPGRDDQDWGEADRTVEAGAAMELALPEGMKQLRLALPPRMAAALLDKDGAVQRLLWPVIRPETFTLTSDSRRLLLLNAASQAGRLSLTVMPSSAGQALAPSGLLRQAQAAAGLLQLEVTTAGKTLSLVFSGPVKEAWVVERGGKVRRGRDGLSVSGEATLLLRHEPGLLAVWLTDSAAPGWLEAAGKAPLQKTAPAALPLSGPEAAWRFGPDQPTLLHLRTAQPVLAVTSRNDQSIWPQGADLQLFLPSGRDSLVGLRPLQDATLSGSARLSVSPAQTLGEGLGPKLRLAPGDARLFTFTLAEAGAVGVGIKGEADTAHMRLFDDGGELKAQGAVALSTLTAGRYFLVVENRADATAAEVQPVLVGVVKPGKAPPEDVKRQYWDMVTVEEGK